MPGTPDGGAAWREGVAAVVTIPLRKRQAPLSPALLRGLLLSLPLSLPLLLAAPPALADAKPALTAFRAGDYARALRLARPLAAKDDPQAMYLLGVMYEQGKGVARDDPTAVRWYAAAARKGDYASAQYNLARMYLAGRGVNRNPAKAKEWLNAAAAQGHPESKALLAELAGGAPIAAAGPAPAVPSAPAAVPKAEAAKSTAPAARAPELAVGPPEPPNPTADPIARPPEPVDRRDFPARTNELAKAELAKPVEAAPKVAEPAAKPVEAARAPESAPKPPARSADTAPKPVEVAKAELPAPRPAAAEPAPPPARAVPAVPPSVPAAAAPMAAPVATPAPTPVPAAPAARSATAADTPVLAAYRGGDYARARKLAVSLSQGEDGPGMYVLGKLYELGQGIKRDDYTAVKWLAAASRKANYAPAQYALARMYVDGRGVGKNLAKAKEWLTVSAGQGDPESQRLLAELGGKPVQVAAATPAPAAPPASAAPAAAPVAEGKPAAEVMPKPAAPPPRASEPVKTAEAPKGLEPPRPAEAPKPVETPRVAESVPQAAPQTAMLSRPAAPAPAASAIAPVTVPSTSSARGGREPAFAAYSASATQTSVNALHAAARRTESLKLEAARAQLAAPMAEVAMRFWEAEALGERKGMADARAAIASNGPMAIGLARQMRDSQIGAERAASALLTALTQSGADTGTEVCAGYMAAAKATGPDHAPAMYHAALCLAQRDAKQSLAWLHGAADTGHAGAMETLGRACIEGAEKNWGCAQLYLERAAQRGRASSMTLYGWVLSNQPSATPKDFTEALAWYRKGAAAGDLFAQNNLGEMYERGRGTARDDKQAREWYGRAAEAGFGPGQFNYARLLLNGTGGPKDHDGAVQWLQKAERNGIEQAKSALQQISASR